MTPPRPAPRPRPRAPASAPGAAGSAARRPGRALARPALLLAAALAGCASPQPLAPPVASEAQLAGRTVTWTSSEPALGAVRWGAHAGAYDHVAYPAAPDEDRAATTAHAVPLLAAAPGDSVYLQTLTRTGAGALLAGPAQAFRLGAAPANPPLLTWTMVDVGFGDAQLLTTPGTRAHVLVDAGERRDAGNVERFLADARVSRLDAVLMTHAHEDHIGGMVGEAWQPDDGVLGVEDVGELVEGPAPSAARSAYAELVALCAQRAIPRRPIAAGDDETTNPALAWDPQVHVRVLHAGGGRALGGDSESEWLNNDSAVLRLTYGAVSFVLGGDAQSPVETGLLAAHATLDASLLKVHHHGSANASDAAYLEAVHPRVGLIPITVYESTNGSLPSTIVLQRLRDHAVDVYASDRAEPLGLAYAADAGGNVTVTTDGRSYEIAVAPSASRHWPPDAAAALRAGSRP